MEKKTRQQQKDLCIGGTKKGRGYEKGGRGYEKGGRGYEKGGRGYEKGGIQGGCPWPPEGKNFWR